MKESVEGFRLLGQMLQLRISRMHFLVGNSNSPVPMQEFSSLWDEQPEKCAPNIDIAPRSGDNDCRCKRC